MGKITLTEKETELIQAIRNYQKSKALFENRFEFEWYINGILQDLLYG